MGYLRAQSGNGRLRILGIAALIAGLAIVAAIAVPGGSKESATAQELSCGDDTFGLLCLRKDAGGRGGSFQFEIETSQRAVPTLVDQCTLFQSTSESNYGEVLGDGDEVAIYFGCDVRVTEVPTRGWDLVAIDCDFDNTYYDVRRDGNGVVIHLDSSLLDSINLGESRRVDCTFINRPEPQPNIGAGLSGLFQGQPTPLPTAPAPAATSPAITPPRTGDGGLK